MEPLETIRENLPWGGAHSYKPQGISGQTLAQPSATLVDLLDRVLERGLLLHADIIISLAGVPLIGINLRAALAGMDTMVKYGLLQEWDKNIREGRGVVKETLLGTEASVTTN